MYGWLLLGFVLATPLLIYARSRGGKAELNILGIALVIAAIIYPGFAVVWGDSEWIIIELIGVPLYSLFYWLAFRQPLWLAAGWLLHPLWDVLLHLNGPGNNIAPEWYATACISFDLLVATYIVVSLRRSHD